MSAKRWLVVWSPEVSGERGGCPGLSSERRSVGVGAHSSEVAQEGTF